MDPTPAVQLEAIRTALRERIAPLVTDDRWATSILLSIDAMLGHLSERVDVEAELLERDSADLRDVLESASVEGAGVPRANPVVLAELRAESRALRGLLETAVDEAESEALAAIDGYLARSLERTRALIAPFAGRTY